MDIDAYEKHIRALLAKVDELMAFKAKVEPMLTELQAQYEAYIEEHPEPEVADQGNDHKEGQEPSPAAQEGPSEANAGDAGAPAPDEAPQGESVAGEAPDVNADDQAQPAADAPAEDAPQDAGEVAEAPIAEEAEKAADEPAEQQAPVSEPEEPPPAAA